MAIAGPFERFWRRFRDAYSAAVLGVTSEDVPSTLAGGLAFPWRLGWTALSLLIAAAICVATHDDNCRAFFLPALMVSGIVGGLELGLFALALSLLAGYALFPSAPFWAFASACLLLTAVGILLRFLFRESRRWGVRYRNLLSATAKAVIISDAAGNIERRHPEFERLTGLRWPDYRGRRWLEAVHPDDRDRLPAAEAAAAAVGMQQIELRLHNAAQGDWRWFQMQAAPLTGRNGKPAEWVAVLDDIHERRLSREQQDMVIGESRHRFKNFITIVDSLAKSSRPRPPEPAVEEFLKKFSGRLHALSAASDLALASRYAAVDVGEIVGATLAPFLEKESGRLKCSGPKVLVSEATGGALAMGLHELATNAIKHGALSVPEGHASFTWTAAKTDGGTQVDMLWEEQGGPTPVKPGGPGYGTRVIGFVPARERNGKVEFDYRPEGLRCRIAFVLPERASAA